MELGLVNVKHFLTIFLNHSIGFLQIHMNKRYVQLFLLLYYKKSIKEKVQFEKETIFDLSIEHYEELYIEMIVIPSLESLFLIIVKIMMIIIIIINVIIIQKSMKVLMTKQ